MFSNNSLLTDSDRWLLPDGVEELLPPDAERIESLRRRLLNLYHAWGYDLIDPPLVEYLESLLTGVGQDLDLKTFKVTDQHTGRLMGIRADMTPQAARIDARLFHKDGTNRLCYAGSVLHAKSSNALVSRTPVQMGCEMFGVPDAAADIEIICLMLESLKIADVKPLHLDIAHVDVYRQIVSESGLAPEREALLFDALRRKSVPEIEKISKEIDNPVIREKIVAFPKFTGGGEVLKKAKEHLGGEPSVDKALAQLQQVSGVIRQRFPDIELCFDFCELRGANYHTGIVFAAYTQGVGYAVAEGGRYDDVGAVFGRARSATGFSLDLKVVSRIGLFVGENNGKVIFAPAGEDQNLWDFIRELRLGNKVIQLMPGEDKAVISEACDREIVRDKNGNWCVKAIQE